MRLPRALSFFVSVLSLVLTPLLHLHRQAAINYFAYDAFRSLYKRVTGQKRIDAVPTLAIGAAAGGVSSTATFPLEVIRKRMQVR